jgi:4a-hydroxytetrahydrobiopterin dehydratase
MSGLSRERIDLDRAKELLPGVPDWSIANGLLTRVFEFDSYASGVSFAAGAGFIADQLDHHPDLLITWCKVSASVSTHDADGLTQYDFELARRLNKLYDGNGK